MIFNRELHDADPGNFPAGVRWSYEHSTGTSGLRKHIKNVHLDLYLQLCVEHKIQPNETIAGKQTTVEPTLPANREPFNKKTLLCYIRNFVVADDQVSFKLNVYI